MVLPQHIRQRFKCEWVRLRIENHHGAVGPANASGSELAVTITVWVVDGVAFCA